MSCDIETPHGEGMMRWMLGMIAAFGLVGDLAARAKGTLEALIERTLEAYGEAALSAPGTLFQINGRI